VLSVSREGAPVTTMRTVKSYFPSAAPMLGPISRFFEGEATSEVGLQAGWRRDVWTAIAPDTSALRPRVEEGDEVFAGAELTPQQYDVLLAQALQGLTRSYADDPPPATFRLIVSPMVTWIWLGAVLAVIGGLISLWPTPRGMTRRVSATYAARVGREVRIPA
jgi:cytochrome c-type biogenesis protein CcmF